jgi:hypothetical protein
MPGPIGKRDSERRRRNKPDIETTTVDIAELAKRDVVLPVADPDWEPLTHSYWESFQSSGQAMFYEPSDWMTAYMLMEVLDRWLKPQDVRTGEYRPGAQEGGEVEYTFTPKIVPIPGNVLSSILKGLTSLMATEGDRRRLKMELERKAAMEAAAGGDATVTDIVKRREDAFRGA